MVPGSDTAWEQTGFLEELSEESFLLFSPEEGLEGLFSSDPPLAKKRRLEEMQKVELLFSPLQPAVWPPLEHASDPSVNM